MTTEKQIGPYALERPLGKRVWLARDRRDSVRRALKLGAVGHETAMLARLCHEGVVALRDSGEGWLAMDVHAQPVEPLALADFRALLQALAHVHERGVVHCDLKVSNLLRGADGALRLADFELARLAGDGPGKVQGTPHCMAPEQMRGLALGFGTDVYAAGVILYRIVMGERPFSGAPFDVVRQVLAGLPGAAAQDSVYGALLHKALALEPQARHADAGALLADFDALPIP